MAKLRKEEKIRLLKMQPKQATAKQRQDARVALERLESTVKFDDNLKAEGKLKSLIKSSKLGRHPMHKLRSYMKAEHYWVADDEDGVFKGELEKGAKANRIQKKRDELETFGEEKRDKIRQEEKANLREEEKSSLLIMQRQRAIAKQRQDARVALERLERTVEFDDNLKAEEEIKSLIKGSKLGKHPMRKLGLYMKAEHYWVADDEDAFLRGDLEEGEIRQ